MEIEVLGPTRGRRTQTRPQLFSRHNTRNRAGDGCVGRGIYLNRVKKQDLLRAQAGYNGSGGVYGAAPGMLQQNSMRLNELASAPVSPTELNAGT